MSRGPREKPARCPRYAEVPSERVRPLRLVVNQRVLAERNPAVAPVGVWVESARDQWQEPGQSTAVVSAYYIEEELKKKQREKEEKLIRFQHEVKRRVNQNARIRKNQQYLKSYNARENQYLTSRRLFMNIEREQVKQMRKQKEHQNEMSEIKKEKELYRNVEEERILRLSQLKEQCLGDREQRMLAHIKLAEQKLKMTGKKKQKFQGHVSAIRNVA